MGELSETRSYKGLTAKYDAFLGRVCAIQMLLGGYLTVRPEQSCHSVSWTVRSRSCSRRTECFMTRLGIYNILSRKSIALQVQAQILACLSLITWGQVYYYGHSWSFSKTIVITSLLGSLGAGLELLGTLPFLLLRDDGSAPHAYLLAMAILSAAGLGLGVLRHYYDIYQHRSVRGISFIFVFLDAAGDLTSLLSVGATVQALLGDTADVPFSPREAC